MAMYREHGVFWKCKEPCYWCSVTKSCQLFATPWTAAHQASLSITICQSLLKLMSIESMMLFPASRSFPMSRLFALGGQSSRASSSTSVLPMNIQEWFPLGSTDLISLLSKGLSSIPTPQFKSISSLALSILYDPTLTSIHDYWKNHSFDYVDFCWQSNVSAF